MVSNTDEDKRDAQRVEDIRLIVSNTDEGKRDAQTRVEGNGLIVSNTDELGVREKAEACKQTNKQTTLCLSSPSIVVLSVSCFV